VAPIQLPMQHDDRMLGQPLSMNTNPSSKKSHAVLVPLTWFMACDNKSLRLQGASNICPTNRRNQRIRQQVEMMALFTSGLGVAKEIRMRMPD
jgi:hypothetical protein